jgi:glycosyltransferase involved in cell wall biosynthesis
MATYNGERFLRQQLHSISLQSSPPDEIIVADDASVDSTVNIVREFTRHSRVPVKLTIREKNLGYTRNFWKALKLSSGDFIFLADQDDVWKRNKIATILQEFANTDRMMVSHDIEVVDQHDKTLVHSYYGAARSMNISPAIVIHGCATAFRRELLELAGFPACPKLWAYDTWLCGIATALGSRVLVDNPLITHRIHEDNTCGWYLPPLRGLRSLMHKTGLPPFTTSSDFDYLMEFYATPDNISEFESRIRTISKERGQQDLESVWKSLALRKAMIAFLADSRYADPLFRFPRCASLFTGLAYRTGGRLRGLSMDILGRRGPV